MSHKKENRGMLDMLENIGFIKKADDAPKDEPIHQNDTPDITPQNNNRVIPDSFWEDTPAYPSVDSETQFSTDEDIGSSPEYTDAYVPDIFVSPEYAKEEPPIYSAAADKPESSASLADTPVFETSHTEIPYNEGNNAPVYRNEPRIEKNEPAYGVSDKVMNGKSFWDDNNTTALLNVDKSLDVASLYATFGLPASGTNTIYIIEEYLKTLPDSLPAELRRSIILKIVAASGFDFDKLLNDGIDRVAKLNEYAETFSRHTDDIISKQHSEIEVLERQIQSHKEIINSRKNLHKNQFLIIENEAQRLKEILDFVTK